MAQADANCDGVRNSADITALFRSIAGDASVCGVMDANCDGHIDDSDAAALVNALFGSELCRATIPASTEMLDADAMDRLVKMDDDGTLHFDDSDALLERLQTGDVLISAPTAATPDGILRHVTSVSMRSGEVLVETAPATLEDAITEGAVATRVQLGRSPLRRLLSPDVVVRPLLLPRRSEGFFFEVKDFVVYDRDGSGSTTNDQARVTGSFALDPTVDFLLAFKSGHLRQFRFVAHETESLDVEGEVTIPFLSFNTEKLERVEPVATLAPIVFYIGVVPVVVQPQINLVVGVKPMLFTAIRARSMQQTIAAIGVQFIDGTWAPVADFDGTFQFSPPTLTAAFDAEFYFGAELEWKLYGIAGPHVAAKGFVELDADVSRRPLWQLFGGLRADSGARVDILSTQLADIDFPGAIGYRRLLAQSDTLPSTGISGQWEVVLTPDFGQPASCVTGRLVVDVVDDGGQLSGDLSPSTCTAFCDRPGGTCINTTAIVLTGQRMDPGVAFKLDIDIALNVVCPGGCHGGLMAAGSEEFEGTIGDGGIEGRYHIGFESCSTNSNCGDVTNSSCPTLLSTDCTGTFSVAIDSEQRNILPHAGGSEAFGISGVDLGSVGVLAGRDH